jgi:hypothetical protein
MNFVPASLQTELIQYVSLGGDCAVAYQLRKHFPSEAYPFDWAKCNKISMVIDTIECNFSNFFDYTLKEKDGDNFLNFETENKSNIHIKLSNNIILPHEADGKILDEFQYKIKYMRRINRFNEIIQNEKIKKIFIRADEKILKNSDKERLIKILKNKGCVNFEIKFISYDSYKTDDFTWQRDYIDWSKIFSL